MFLAASSTSSSRLVPTTTTLSTTSPQDAGVLLSHSRSLSQNTSRTGGTECTSAFLSWRFIFICPPLCRQYVFTSHTHTQAHTYGVAWQTCCRAHRCDGFAFLRRRRRGSSRARVTRDTSLDRWRRRASGRTGGREKVLTHINRVSNRT